MKRLSYIAYDINIGQRNTITNINATSYEYIVAAVNNDTVPIHSTKANVLLFTSLSLIFRTGAT